MEPFSIPGFEVLGKIGEGGMASVWKARQLSLDRLVAIKALSASAAGDPADVERFQAECRSMGMLKHPGIVHVHDALVHAGHYCLIMEYVDGESIGARIRRTTRMTEDDVLRVLLNVAQALGHAWKTTGLVHLDLKPDNILIDADGSVKVADFGLATTITSLGFLSPTSEVMGTPPFMSPEQIRGKPKPDCRSDIYSMGATAYQMLTGRLLFEGMSDEAVLSLHLKGHASDAMDLVPSLSSRICWLTEKMLARDREHRHADWDAVTADVKRLLLHHDPVLPMPRPKASVMKRSANRKTIKAPAPIVPSATARTGGDSAARVVLYALLLTVLLAIAVIRLFPRFKNEAFQTVLPPQWLPTPSPATPHPPPAAPSPETRAEERQPAKRPPEATFQEVLAILKSQADPLAAKGRFRDAAAVYESYSGPLAKETARDRAAEAEALHEQDARKIARP